MHDALGLSQPLVDGTLRVEPLREEHREALRAACAEDLEVWALYAVSYDPPHFDQSFERLLHHPARLPMFLSVDGECLGMTAWINPDPTMRTVEIGNTFLRPKFRGGVFNGRLKRLLFTHAFSRGLKRIQLCVDVRNLRSQAACRKVGATFEGVLRNHLITWTGHERDTAVFSVVERDRARLGL